MNQSYLSSMSNPVLSLKPSKAIRLLLMVLFVLWYGNNITAQTFKDNTSGSRIWTVPCYVTSIKVEAWGGGGGGGAADNNPVGGSGGGGGGYSSYTIAVTPGQDINYTIGGAGTGGIIANGGKGGDGLTTTFLGLTANGGKGGLKDRGNAGAGGIASGGTTNINGTAGVRGTFVSGAAGGLSNGLAGGNSRNTIGNGNDAINPGSGGGGGFRNGGSKNDGGNGANGQIKITYTTSTVVVGTITQPTCALSTGSVILSNLPASGSWTLTRSPGGVTASGTGTSTTISGLSSGTYTYKVSIGSCISEASSNVVVNAQPATPVQPTFGEVTQPTCSTATGSFLISNYNSYYTYVFTPAVGVTNTAGTITAPVGSYKVKATLGSCTSIASESAVVSKFVETANDWDGTSWSNGTPNSNQKLVFAGDYPPATDPDLDIEGCSCKITGSKTVKIKSGRTLAITNEVTVEGNGYLIFENNSSLVQINNTAVNKGDIEYQRSTSSPVLKTDYVYWSSPVLGLSLQELSKETANGTFYSFDTSTENWSPAYDGTLMDIGKGYIVRRPDFDSAGNTVITEAYTANFKGQPNNGIKTIPGGWSGASEGTSNLLGNPYPSALDADKFLTENKNVLDGTLYFWTHNTQIGIGVSNPGTGVFAYSSDDYASYNFTGGVGTLPDTRTATGNLPGGIPANEIKANKPSGKIAAGQGFFATSIGLGNVTFTNDMRVSGGGVLGNNNQFFKTKDLKGKTANTLEKNRIWLNLTNTQGAFKQTLIGYITDATNDYDNLFDGESFDGNEFVDFYSVNQDRNLVIQGRALPLEETDEVPLGYRTTIDGNFTINIDEVDGSMTDQEVFIEDKLTNTVFNLKTGNYTFSTAPGTFNDRFVLRYNNKTLGTEDFDSPANKVLVSNANKQIKINSFAETIDKVVIYDLLGRQVFQKANVNNNELSIANLISSHQTLVVKTVLQNGNIFTDKIIY